jgi:hypothetical protein
VNIEGEECARWIFDGDTILLFSLVGGRWLGVLELALQLLFGQKEFAHLLGTSQDLLMSFLEVYFWSRWTKGSRGSSMEDIGAWITLLQLAVLRLDHHFICMVVLLRSWGWKWWTSGIQIAMFTSLTFLGWKGWSTSYLETYLSYLLQHSISCSF